MRSLRLLIPQKKYDKDNPGFVTQPRPTTLSILLITNTGNKYRSLYLEAQEYVLHFHSCISLLVPPVANVVNTKCGDNII